jgi:hypothetical protein
MQLGLMRRVWDLFAVVVYATTAQSHPWLAQERTVTATWYGSEAQVQHIPNVNSAPAWCDFCVHNSKSMFISTVWIHREALGMFASFGIHCIDYFKASLPCEFLHPFNASDC